MGDDRDDFSLPEAADRGESGETPMPESVAFAACLGCHCLVFVVSPDGLPTALLDPSPALRVRFWSELPPEVEPFFVGLDFATGRRGFHGCG